MDMEFIAEERALLDRFENGGLREFIKFPDGTTRDVTAERIAGLREFLELVDDPTLTPFLSY